MTSDNKKQALKKFATSIPEVAIRDLDAADIVVEIPPVATSEAVNKVIQTNQSSPSNRINSIDPSTSFSPEQLIYLLTGFAVNQLDLGKSQAEVSQLIQNQGAKSDVAQMIVENAKQIQATRNQQIF